MTDIRIGLAEARDPLVLALDVGSTASRGGLYDAAGRPVRGRKHKVPHAFTTAADGTSQIDPDQVCRELERIIDVLATPEVAGRVAGVALDTFASSLVGVDGRGEALTPCLTYADSRNAAQAARLRQELDEDAVHDRTGCRLHTSYLPARLRWLADTEPGTFARVRRWVSLGEYVHLHLLGQAVVGTSTAAWSGMLDRRTGHWDPTMLEAAGTTPDHLSAVHDPGEPLTDVPSRWPALTGVAWFPVVADGIASNIGAGATDAATVAAALATSGALRVLLHEVPEQLPAGLWCYRVDHDRWLLGGALNDVGRMATWLGTTLRLPEDVTAVLTAPPTPDTPLVLPYLTGERSPGWATGARATLAGISAATTPAALFRGAMEGVALAYARVAEPLQAAAGQPRRLVASGRVSQDLPGLLQVLADVLQTPVDHVTMKRTTLRGTALLALEHLAPDVERAASEVGATARPSPEHAAYYASRRRDYDALYRAVL